jgi:hypothetical protein
MNAPRSQRPLGNGSSGSTVEVLLGLTVVGASMLTAFALLPRRRRREPPDDSEAKKDEEERDDAGD